MAVALLSLETGRWSRRHYTPFIGRGVALVILRINLALIGSVLVNGCGLRGTEDLKFALPTADWWTAAPFTNSKTSELFNREGVTVTFLEVNSGLASKNAVVAGTADIGLSAATPLALAAARQEKLIILGTYLHSRGIVGLLRPRDAESQSVVEPVAMVPSTISESFLYNFLAARGDKQKLEKKELRVLNLRPADIPAALQNGSAGSAVVWEPFLSLATQDGRFAIERNAPNFDVSLYIITRPSVLKSNEPKVRSFLKAVQASCMHVRTDSEKVRQEIERRFGFTNNFLALTWPTVDYGLTNDHNKMRAEIVREAEVAKALGYIGEIPSIDYFFTDRLLLESPSPAGQK